MFTLKIGTVMEGSKLSCRVWAVAIYLFTTNLKGKEVPWESHQINLHNHHPLSLRQPQSADSRQPQSADRIAFQIADHRRNSHWTTQSQ